MGSVGHRHRKGSANYDGMKLMERREEKEKARANFVAERGEVSTEAGSVPLDDERAERYCRKVVEGIEPREAWQQAFKDECGLPRAKRSSATSLRFRLHSKPEVQARISALAKGLGAEEPEGEEEDDEEAEEKDVVEGDAVEDAEEATRFSKTKKRRMLDDLLEETYRRAKSGGSTAKDVGAFLDVMARHDLINGEVSKPKLEVVFPQLEAIFGKAAKEAVERRLGVKGNKPHELPGETQK